MRSRSPRKAANIYIFAAVRSFAPQLSPHVQRRADLGEGQHAALVKVAAEAEVPELEVAGGHDEDIAGLYVAVDDALVVHVTDGLAGLGEVRPHLLFEEVGLGLASPLRRACL